MRTHCPRSKREQKLKPKKKKNTLTKKMRKRAMEKGKKKGGNLNKESLTCLLQIRTGQTKALIEGEGEKIRKKDSGKS